MLSETTNKLDKVYDFIEWYGEPYEGVPFFPSWAYREYLELFRWDEPRPHLYVSMAITSGGYNRDSSLDIGEVIAKNTQYGDHLRAFFDEQGMSPQEIIIPSELGSMRQAEWGQLDFLMFWFHIMSGVTYDQAHRLEYALRHTGYYQDAKWSQKEMLQGNSEEKWQVYEAFTLAYAEQLSRLPSYKPVEMVIGGLDAKRSLGGRAEELLARQLGIPYCIIEAQENAISPEFRQELDTLHALGAEALTLYTEEGPRFMFRSPASTTP